jgi:hypothetical protein
MCCCFKFAARPTIITISKRNNIIRTGYPVFLSSPALSLPIGQANSAEGEVLVQSHTVPSWTFGEEALHLVVDWCVANTLCHPFWLLDLFLICRVDLAAALIILQPGQKWAIT